MVIGIVTVRNPRYHPNRRLVEAGAKMGHKVVLVHPNRILPAIHSGNPRIGSGQEKLDALLPRIGSTINEYTLTLVRHFELLGVPVVNGFRAVSLARHKYLSLQTLARQGLPVPDSYLVGTLEDLRESVRKLGGYPVVAKILNSRQGSGVVRLRSAPCGEFIVHMLMGSGQGFLVQEYLDPTEKTQIRAFVLGDNVAAAMELKPKNGDFRANVHVTGRGKAVTVDCEIEALAVSATEALGLEISGTDIMVDHIDGHKIIEVNYSPGFRGLEAATGLDIASEIIRYIERTHGASS